VTGPALFIIGHGTRDEAGVAEFRSFVDVVRAEAAPLAVGGGFIELAEPDLDTALDELLASGAATNGIVAVPLVLLGAGHLKNDGPGALARARRRHPNITMTYGRELGVHPTILSVAEARAREAMGTTDPDDHAVVLVGRGSTDPDANSDLHKVCRLVWDQRRLGLVEPAFVSLAPPSVPAALDRCRRLGATTISVVPFFLFAGVLPDRIGRQARSWASEHPDIAVRVGRHFGATPELARLVMERYDEARHGDTRMNCDCCAYRTPLPGYESRVGQPVAVHRHDHSHGPAPDHHHDPSHAGPDHHDDPSHAGPDHHHADGHAGPDHHHADGHRQPQPTPKS
jgi:sirohydrochlorin ferrochelatase